MGITKQYLRYVPSDVINTICSGQSQPLFIQRKGSQASARVVATAACEIIHLWDTRTGEQVRSLAAGKDEIMSLARSPSSSHIAAGYKHGTLRLWDVAEGTCVMTVKGHNAGVTALTYDKDGMRLASGSQDTDIVMWDVVAESGLYRLHGHKFPVTQVKFFPEIDNLLASSSKDMTVKIWDLVTQHCCHTIVGHRSEVWDLVIVHNYVVTGSGDSELRVWRVTPTVKVKSEGGADDVKPETSNTEELVTVVSRGSILRTSKTRVLSMAVNPEGDTLACHGADKFVELFHICSPEERRKKLQKRIKRIRKRKLENSSTEEIPTESSLQDEIKRLHMLSVEGKVGGVDVLTEESGCIHLAVAQRSNSLTTWRVEVGEEGRKVAEVHQPAHRADVRTLAPSSFSDLLFSAGAESLRVWSRNTGACLHALACEYALCSLVVPGDRHVVIGCKSGRLQIFDVSAGELLETIDAHTGAVWGIHQIDKNGFVTCSADHTVKQWEYELLPGKQTHRLSSVHTRTLQLEEDALSVKCSANSKLIAVALLDNTVKVFFQDTFKFFLNLYGHSLPVLCMDICDDSTLLVTGGSDRTVKIWGLDFGDCHRSLRAGEDSIMCIEFIPKTHMFFSGSKDGKIKQWDADNFQMITQLDGHQSSVWSLCVSPCGLWLASASHDKSIRFWNKTEEILILGEEQEARREEEEELATQAGSVLPGETNKESALPSLKTVDSEKAAEKLMEALDVYKDVKNVDLDSRPPLMLMYNVTTPAKLISEVLKRIKPTELEECLLILPFPHMMTLFSALSDIVSSGGNCELYSKAACFLLRIHQGQIRHTPAVNNTIIQLRDNTTHQLQEAQDTFGYNLAGLRYLQRELKQRHEIQLFTEATSQYNTNKKKKKKKEGALRRAILTLQ